jgi:peptidoglycan LD-endopeptidase CwlK
MASRSLNDLHPAMRGRAEALLARSEQAGVPLVVTFTLRSLAEQDSLYAQGRTAPGSRVTNARAGYSFHNFGLAIDIVPRCLLTLPRWGDTPENAVKAAAIWQKVGSIGRTLGLRWGGDFTTLKDRPHFEWSSGLTLAELRAGRRPPVS